MVFGHQDRHSAERSIGLKSCFFVATSIKRRITYNRSVSSIDQALAGRVSLERRQIVLFAVCAGGLNRLAME
jgi:hypothetical protein